MDQTTPILCFLEGHQANLDGLTESANPYLFDAWPYKAWKEGHDFASKFNPAAILRHDEPLKRVEVSPREQGFNAFTKGLHIDACPYEPETKDWFAWRAGWIDNIRPPEPPMSKFENAAYAILALFIVLSLVGAAAVVYFVISDYLNR